MEKNKNNEWKKTTLVKKIKAINYKGGKCIKCQEKNIYKLCFHHRNPEEKEYEWVTLKGRKWEVIKTEIEKCDLLCHNCHVETHEELSTKKERRNEFKKKLLEIKGSCCNKCGYNKSVDALEFHHINPDEKEFSIGNRNNICERLINELEKCDLLCKNCHIEYHTDVDFYERNMKEILEKVGSFKGYKSYNKNEIFENFENGYKQVDIRKKYNLSKSTVHGLYKKFLLKYYQIKCFGGGIGRHEGLKIPCS